MNSTFSPADLSQIPSSPIASLGDMVLLVAFAVNAYALVAGVLGQHHRRRHLVKSALYASWAWTAIMCVAASLMVYAFVSHDYTIKYVAHYSDMSMSLFYKLTAFWGGLDGSLLFWVWMLSLFSAVAFFVNRKRHRDMIGYAVATVAGVVAFFLAILIFVKNPFGTFLTEPPFDGKGLNPLLQNYWMSIHPPSLYVGFVGMTVPFAFCIAALASGRLDDAWVRSMRVWVLIGWFFLSLGLVLGCIWAYEELGWGGYWAWDPVENAGLLPWFTATAFLHSIQIQERRGMFKTWNVVLVVTTFFLTIFGTFMTRSGVVQSVHAFGQDNELAMLFILFMVALLVFSFGLIVYRMPQLRSSNTFESFLSREFVILFNNWILLSAAFFVLFATMFPTLSEAIMNERITVGAPFFNKWMVPFGLVLLFLTGAGPLLAWRVTSAKRLLQQFLFPVTVMLVTLGAIALFARRWLALSSFMSDKLHLPIAWLCFGLVAFVLGSVAQEFYRGMRVRQKNTGGDPFTALIGIVLSKRRKYGGYVVHVAMALMFLGFAGGVRGIETPRTLKEGESFQAEDLTFRLDDVTAVRVPATGPLNRTEYTAEVSMMRGDKVLAHLRPARWAFARGETTTEVAIDRNLDRDVYLVINNFDPQAGWANLVLYLNPLVDWIWLGFGIFTLGTLICLLPESTSRWFAPRRARAAKAGQAAGSLLIILGVLGALGRLAYAAPPVELAQADTAEAVEGGLGAAGQSQGGGMAPALLKPEDQEQAARLTPAQERVFARVKADVLCMCGDCQRRTVGSCECGFAEKERTELLGRIKAASLGSTEDEQKLYDQIIQSYIDRYGGQHALTVPIDRGFNRLAWGVPVAAVAAALVLLVLVGRRFVRRSASPPANANAAGPSAADIALADRLDDELDEID